MLAATYDNVNGGYGLQYDDLNHLKSASGTSGAPSYSWNSDRFSNLWSQTVTAGIGSKPSYTFGTDNNFSAVPGIYTDVLGNVTNDGVYPYTYDAENRIVQVAAGTTAIATYQYDAFGRRIRRTLAGSHNYDYFYDLAGRVVSATYDGTWNRSEGYIGDRHFLTYNSTANYYAHVDWLGNERVRTTTGAALYTACYDRPFGDDLSCGPVSADNDVSPMHYTGYERDSETGNYHSWFRYYNPRLQRFMTTDPLSGDIGDPQSLNKFGYVENNPVNWTDPLGLYTYCGDHCNYDPGNSGYDASQGNCASGITRDGFCQIQISIIRDMFGDDPGPPVFRRTSPAPNNGMPDNKSCAARLAAGVQKNTVVTPTNLQYTGTIGGHANYSFDVSDPTGFQSILSNNPPFSLPFGIDQGYRYGVIQSTHVENTLTGGFSGHTDIFSGHSIFAPLHLLVDVGIGHIPGVNLDFGCKAGS